MKVSEDSPVNTLPKNYIYTFYIFEEYLDPLLETNKKSPTLCLPLLIRRLCLKTTTSSQRLEADALFPTISLHRPSRPRPDGLEDEDYLQPGELRRALCLGLCAPWILGHPVYPHYPPFTYLCAHPSITCAANQLPRMSTFWAKV